jgi:carboxymethylenebutenolidase
VGETIKLTAADGHTFDAYVASPEGTPKAALVVVQEIFGVNAHIRSVADHFALEGYLAVAPALFDRKERGVELGYEGADMQKAMTLIPKTPDDMQKAVADTAAAVAYGRDEYKTQVGVVGYCWGGSVAWLAAAELPIAAAVGYYGGFIAKSLEYAPKVPIMLHFGRKDDHIPMEDIEKIEAAYPEIPVYLYDAGHGFNCSVRGSYDEPSAKLALERTLAFFAENLSAPINSKGTTTAEPVQA